MDQLCHYVRFVSGTPQSRLFISSNESDPSYYVYGQMELKNDLIQEETEPSDSRCLRTTDKVITFTESDVVFNLISGEASVVGRNHLGFMQTQNFVKLQPNEMLDRYFLVFLLNENQMVKRQLFESLQGSKVIKYTLTQLKALKINELPSIEEQRLIGRMYFNQLRLNWLLKRSADLKYELRINQLRRG
ncbi:restriction endonuclease subunit M [Latilactobacillus sakei]